MRGERTATTKLRLDERQGFRIEAIGLLIVISYRRPSFPSRRRSSTTPSVYFFHLDYTEASGQISQMPGSGRLQASVGGLLSLRPRKTNGDNSS